MPNKLTLTAPLALPEMTFIRVTQAREVNDTTKRIVFDLQLYSGDDPATEVVYPNALTVVATNGPCTKITWKPVSNIVDLFSSEEITPDDNPDLEHAFDLVMGAYATTGPTGVLNQLQELGLVPAGTAS